ncbi:MAG TPA: S9 family peptidase [Chthoniobacterales bacterium]|jgi:dipeptidyl aminopeptidase/acylaminoacyl peptidase
MKLKSLLVALIVCHAAMVSAEEKHPFTFAEMMALKRVGEPVPTPDGKWVLFAAEDVDLKENKKTSHLWIVPAAGGDARRLSQTPNDESRPRISPDGKRLIFTSKATNPAQIWISDFESTVGKLAGASRQLTALSSGGGGGIWAPNGKSIVFTSSVYPDCPDDACNQQRDEELKKSNVKAKIFTRLFYRHWKDFTEFKRSHLFFVSPDGSAPPRDLTPGDHDVPPFSLGGADMYDVSPDGQEVAYTSNIDEVEATSTNNEIFLVPIGGGTPRKISTSPGSDSNPRYSPDGKSIAWRSQARGGYESDRFTLAVYDRASQKIQIATQDFDRSVGSFVWAPDSKTIYFSAEDHGEAPIYRLSLGEKRPAELARLHADDLIFGGEGKSLYLTRNSIQSPNEIWRLNVTQQSEPTAVTHINDHVLSRIAMQPLESFTFKGAENAEVQGFLVRPSDFDARKKYPIKFLIHGGPEGAWGDDWSYRWNPELFGADGYVVVMINPHGSTGYGQKFTEGVLGDWGGKPFADLMKGLGYAEKTYPFIDKDREAALGASYGGYMINWIFGHTNRFKCLVSHDGMFNTESAYGTAEELWFPEWEFRGPPWKSRELYRKWSPHLSAEKFKTPTLVVHGQLDYRLDVSEGFQLFTTLQRRGVPSEMLYFPDEGHWVLKPQNAQLWYKTVNGWVDRWTKR